MADYQKTDTPSVSPETNPALFKLASVDTTSLPAYESDPSTVPNTEILGSETNRNIVTTIAKTTLTPKQIEWGKSKGAISISGLGILTRDDLQKAIDNGYYEWKRVVAGTSGTLASNTGPTLFEVVEAQNAGILPKGEPQKIMQTIYEETGKYEIPEIPKEVVEEAIKDTIQEIKPSEDKYDSSGMNEYEASMAESEAKRLNKAYEKNILKYTQNPFDEQYYKNEDLGSYVIGVENNIPVINWAKFNQDQAYAKLSSTIDEVGESEALKSYELNSDLNIHDQVALAAYKKQQSLASEIDPYAVYEPMVGPLKEGMTESERPQTKVGYDLYSYVNDNINKGTAITTIKSNLSSAGFDSDTINTTIDEVKEKQSTLASLENEWFRQPTEEMSQRLNSILTNDEKRQLLLNNPDITDEAKIKLENYSGNINIGSAKRENLINDYNNLTDTQKEKVLAQYGAELDISLWDKAKYIVPVYGTYLTAKERGLTSGWTIASIIGDALILGTAIKGASTGARTYGYPGTTGRMKAAVKGAVSNVVGIPENASDVAKNIKNTVLGITDKITPDYIPLSGIETSSGTIRIPISVAGSAEDALAIRESLMNKLIAGEKPSITYKNVVYELDQSLISGVTHTSPMAGEIAKGTTVAIKEGKPISEQGLFVGSGIHSRFARSSAFGISGELPGAITYASKTVVKTSPTGKIYRGTVELEKKFEVGTELPSVKKYGYSRTSDGVKFSLFSEENISTIRKIALKLSEPVTDIRSIFKPAITVKGRKVGSVDLLKEASRFDEAAITAEKQGNFSLASLLRNEASSLREERLARPLTAGAANTLAAEFSKYAQGLKRTSNQLRSAGNITDANLVYTAYERVSVASDYLKRMSSDKKMLNTYNSYLKLNDSDKIFMRENNLTDNDIITIVNSLNEPVRSTITKDNRTISSADSNLASLPIDTERNITATTSRENLPNVISGKSESTAPRSSKSDTDISRITAISNKENLPTKSSNERVTVASTRTTPARSDSIYRDIDNNGNKPPIDLPDFEFNDGTRSANVTGGMIALYHGTLRGNREVWYFGKWPYKDNNDFVRYVSPKPLPYKVSEFDRGKGASKRSYQLLFGSAPSKDIDIDMGIQDVILSKDMKATYKRDIGQKTRSSINVKNIVTSGARKSRRRLSRSKGKDDSVTAYVKSFWR